MGCLSENRLREYLDGELHSPALGHVDDHLAVCASCRKRLEEMRAQEDTVNRALSRLASYGLPQEAFDLREISIRQKRAPTRYFFRTSVPLPLSLLAAMVVLLLAMAGVVFFQQRAIIRLTPRPETAARPLEIMIGNDRVVLGHDAGPGYEKLYSDH